MNELHILKYGLNEYHDEKILLALGIFLILFNGLTTYIYFLGQLTKGRNTNGSKYLTHPFSSFGISLDRRVNAQPKQFPCPRSLISISIDDCQN
jgi:hypothetical protein